jgi:hypothetical protein
MENVTSASSEHNSNKGYIFTNPSAYNDKENYNSCNSENNINITKSECLPFLGENQKNIILNNSKFTYDNNTMRNRKRSEQMKKIRSNHESKDFREDDSLSKFLKEHERTNIIISGDYDCLKIPTFNEMVTNSEKIKPEDEERELGEVLVSDIDGSIEEDQSTNKASFVPIKNILAIKNNIKEDNATESYLLALNQYNEEEVQYDNDINEETNPYDSLNDKLRSRSNREFRHVRLPSV